MEWKDSSDEMEDAVREAFEEQKRLYADIRQRGIEELFTRILCAVINGLGPHMDRRLAEEDGAKVAIPLGQYVSIARELTHEAGKEILKLREGARSTEESP